MSRCVKYTIFQLITWTLVGLGLIIVVTRPGVIMSWGDNSVKSLVLAILFLGGFGTDFIIRLLEKSVKFGYMRDERTESNQLKAMSLGFVIVLIYMFLYAIAVYTKFEDSGLVPVAYIWILAYSSIVVANIAVGLPMIVIYRKQGY